jgi:hypothetical protein
MILSCGPNGIGTLLEFDKETASMKEITECCFNNVLLSNLTISPPNKMIRSTRINSASFQPSFKGEQSSLIAAVQRSDVFLYDISTGRVKESNKVF